MSGLSLKDVSKSFAGKLVVDRISFTLDQPGVYGLLGTNGAGKTTTIRMLLGIISKDSGEITWNGEPVDRKTVNFGYLPEERGLYRNMKVGDQAMYLAQLKGLSRKEAATRLHQWFEKFGIDSWWNKKVMELSKGMQQKIQFVVTVLHRPKLLIFDEPFSGFDPLNAQLLKDEILNLRKEGSTVIFSTHNMASVEEICDEIALINKSRKVLDGKVEDIRRQFSGNVYHVSLKSEEEKVSALRSELEVLGCERRDTPGLYDLKIRLPQGDTGNTVLQALMKYGDVKEFSEKLPGMNDIFIQTVKNAEANEK